MTSKEIQNEIKMLIDTGQLDPDMDVFTFDGSVYRNLHGYCIDTVKNNSLVDAEGALVIDARY